MILDLVIGDKNSAIARKLFSIGLLPLMCEVRWGIPTPDSNFYLHGLLMKNLTSEQGVMFLNELRAYLSSQMPELVGNLKKAS